MASGSLLRRATCQCLSNLAPLAYYKRLITVFPTRPLPSIFVRTGGARRTPGVVAQPKRGKSKTLTPTVKFSNPRDAPGRIRWERPPARPRSLPPPAPAPPRGAQAGGGLGRQENCTQRESRGQRALGSAPVQ